MKINQLPYFDERTEPIDTLVIHCLAFDVTDGIQSFSQNQVSSHYIISPKGAVVRLIDENKRAWHAGKSFWRGRENLNHRSIGIELCHPFLGQSAYSSKQISALIRLCQKIIRRYHIKPQNVIGHSDIAPTRKSDPGKGFPWQYLARHGIGNWYNLKNSNKVQNNNVKELLSNIGYEVSNLVAAQYAFCRHFMPDVVLTDNNIPHLLENPYPNNFKIADEVLLPVLKAVTWQFGKKIEMQVKSSVLQL